MAIKPKIIKNLIFSLLLLIITLFIYFMFENTRERLIGVMIFFMAKVHGWLKRKYYEDGKNG